MASLVYALLWCLSLVPLRLLYVLSWAAAWVLRVGIRYRRKVVEDNLRACFPEASDHELHQWTKGYYRHLADVMVEMIKVASMSPNQLASRMKLDHDALGQSIYQGGKGGVIIASHYGNFEWLSLRCGSWLAEHGVPSAGIYARLSKGSWGKIILSLRAKWGMLLIPKHKALIKSLFCLQTLYTQ